MRSARIHRNLYRVLAAALLLTLVGTGLSKPVGYAAVNIPDTIRVGLFLNLPSKNFANVTPAATLQSATGMNLVWRDPAFNAPVGQAAPGEPVRFAMDGYRAVVLETAEFGGALAAWKKIQASSKAAFITRLSKSGKTVYQVTEGVYASPSAASAALDKWKASGAASGVQAAADPKIAGPWAVESGPYAGKKEAQAAADRFGSLGIDAFPAIKVQNGAPVYVVRIGQEADASGLEALKQAAAAAGGINVRVPQSGEPYAVVRQDMSVYGAEGRPVALYAIPSSGGVALRAEPGGEGAIQVTERYQRSYRGALEMSVYADALAVVNEVDLEQYLYSVVGAEVGSGWPMEAQKAQAVAARSFALSSGNGFDIAHVVDTTLSQAYNGTGSENANSTAAVNATAGEVLTYNNQIINAVFSSNAGGITADNRTEVWGSDVPYLAGGTVSPDDGAQEGLLDWYDAALLSGRRGYIRSDLLEEAGKNAAGIRMMKVKEEGTALRVRPKIESSAEPIARLSRGTIVVPLQTVPENTAYRWVEDPFSAEELRVSLNKYFKISSPLQTLEITGRGPSGRVTEVTVNGEPLSLKTPDSWRSALGGLRSTLMTIEETARMTLRGAGGTTRELPQQAGTIHVLGADGDKGQLGDQSLFVMDASGQARVVTSRPSFVIAVKGFGHGLGMSQYGAKKLAEQGNDYRFILQYYYKNAVIEKDAGG